MILKNRLLQAVLIACLFIHGCQQAETEPNQPVTAFEGSVDSRFVGEWKTENGQSSYTLKPDGSFQLKSKVSTPGGTMNTESKGSWLVKDDRMLFKGADGLVAAYRHSLSGNRLTLSLTGKMKRQTVLIKQKP